MFTASRHIKLLFNISLGLIAIFALWLSPGSAVNATQDFPISPLAAPEPASATAGSLHNPNFDNGIWYEFHLRHDPSYPKGVWIPAGDTYDDPQDWRLWFLNGTGLVDSDPSTSLVQSAPESVQFRNFNGTLEHQVAGLYQVIPGVTPCLQYQFQIYGASRPKEGDDSLNELKAGIERTGWTLDPQYAPAVHTWPTTMVWGSSQKPINAYGLLSVTAEALSDQITVFSYADALGGNSHKIHWDSASLQEITPELLHDPLSLPSPTILNARAEPGSTSATVYWTSSVAGLSQVLYRPSEAQEIPEYPNKIYVPMVMGGSGGETAEWQATLVDKQSTTDHIVTITNLTPGRAYDFVVLSRGPSGNECVTAASAVQTFTTIP
jgi:hypothetical protein